MITKRKWQAMIAENEDLRARLADLETKLGEVEAAQIMLRAERDGLASMLLSVQQESIAATKALGTARRDALGDVLHLMPRYYGVWSSTGVHIGVWEDGATAAEVLEEYPQGVMRDLVDMEAIRALAQEESKL
jgi:hypothetical protein